MPDSPAQRPCPRCSAPVAAELAVCPRCASPLPPPGVGPITVAPPSDGGRPLRRARLSRLPTLPDLPPSVATGVRPRVLAPPAIGGGQDYELTAVVGEGGMGVVWAARQAGLGREVAIKRVRPGSDMPRTGRQLLAEAVLTGQLEHPGIVPVHEVGVDQDGMPFYSMRRLRGRTWDERWNELTQREHLEILLRVCDAVAYAHGQGVLHRDIKPGNVFLGEYGEVQLIDWGLALRLTDLRAGRMRATAAGTPAYLAPEMARADARAMGIASDVYLLGATLFEILTGLPPHPGEDQDDIVMAAAENRIDPDFPAGDLGAVARRAMDADPANRPADVRAFQRALRECLEHQESAALVGRAEERLSLARAAGDHDGFARAMHVFEDALALWPGNPTARSGLSAARLSYALHARAAGDLELAATLLDPADPAHRGEAATLAVQRRRFRRWRRILIGLAWISLALLVALLTALAIGFLAVRHQRDLILRISAERDAAEARLAREESADQNDISGHPWRRLVQEDFLGGVLPPLMRITSGNWDVASQAMVVSGTVPATAVISLPAAGDVRVQYDMRGRATLLIGCDQAEAVRGDGSGLAVEVGERMIVRSAGLPIAERALPEAVPGLARRVRIETDRGTLRVMVDGSTVLDRTDLRLPPPLHPLLGIHATPGTMVDNLMVEVPR